MALTERVNVYANDMQMSCGGGRASESDGSDVTRANKSGQAEGAPL